MTRRYLSKPTVEECLCEIDFMRPLFVAAMAYCKLADEQRDLIDCQHHETGEYDRLDESCYRAWVRLFESYRQTVKGKPVDGPGVIVVAQSSGDEVV